MNGRADDERIEPRWRLIAAVVALGWLVTAVVLLIASLGLVTHRLAPLGFTIALVAGLPVLALLKGLGAEGSSAPGERETRLAAIAAGMLVLAWAVYVYA